MLSDPILDEIDLLCRLLQTEVNHADYRQRQVEGKTAADYADLARRLKAAINALLSEG